VLSSPKDQGDRPERECILCAGCGIKTFFTPSKSAGCGSPFSTASRTCQSSIQTMTFISKTKKGMCILGRREETDRCTHHQDSHLSATIIFVTISARNGTNEKASCRHWCTATDDHRIILTDEETRTGPTENHSKASMPR